ncbi:MAG TPA: hypothetical protein VIQ24_00135 [Pyrinomonadaceae bacterium]
MSSTSEQEQRNKSPRSEKDVIYWEGGVKFGGAVALIMAGIELMTRPERYYPLWPLNPAIAFSWLWMLIVHPIIYFGVGCLFGLMTWAIYGERSEAGRDE